VLVELSNKTDLAVQEGDFALVGCANKRKMVQQPEQSPPPSTPASKRQRAATPHRSPECRSGFEALAQVEARPKPQPTLRPWEATLVRAIRKQGFLPFQKVQVFSNSQNKWVNARVASVAEDRSVTVLYAGPAGQAVKQLQADSKDIRRHPSSSEASFEEGHVAQIEKFDAAASPLKMGAPRSGSSKQLQRMVGSRGGA
jgi:hypothetical protein